uniref:uncharacterized protein LOC105353298 n=1 Tax=Fragaria vesca subsp. vesca TaxID=101020 RepID=UPI0005CAB615|nr:PREDICTED: uncharacterized protein LOC105353298 [Fragaria vesca subsp. vesca]
MLPCTSERVISTHSSQEAANHRLRLIATIEGVRLLAKQGCAFRGNDESADSTNRGNFDAILSSFGRMNLEVQRVFDNAHGNAKYTSPLIQKQIANILGNKVREKIRDEVGLAKFCILVDEVVDASSKEQMAIILRFVDCHGFIRERSEDVCNLALKFYPEDFTSYDLSALDMECGFFVADILADPRFFNTSSFLQPQQKELFQSMNIIKSRLRNKMEDDFLDDLMVLYIEKEFADSVDNDYVIQEFEVSGTRRVRFR